MYVGSIPLYGYQRDGEGFLTPDEETKGIVQRIYREYLSGKVCTVITIIDCNKAYLHKRKNMFDIIAKFNVVSSESGKILDNNTLYFPLLYSVHHLHAVTHCAPAY